MRYSLVLVAAFTCALAACESSNNRYGLSGDDNMNSRTNEYSGAKDSATSGKDASWNNNKDMDRSPDAPSHSPDMAR